MPTRDDEAAYRAARESLELAAAYDGTGGKSELALAIRTVLERAALADRLLRERDEAPMKGHFLRILRDDGPR